MNKFSTGVGITSISQVINLSLGVFSSVILARVLGPEGRGIYGLAILLPSLIVTFGNLGIGSATVYYVASNEFSRQEILGTNVLLSILISGIGIGVGIVIALVFQDPLFSGVPLKYLLLALSLVPLNLLFASTRYILLGAQHIKAFNYVQIIRSVVFLASLVISLLGLKGKVSGAILANIVTWTIVDVFLLYVAKKVAGGIKLGINTVYLKRALTYGIQAHVSNVLSFLNYRADMFLVNGFLGPSAVGLYAVGVGLAEKVWMVSQSAGTVLFPRVASEQKEERRKHFTPLVARTVLWVTIIGSLVLFFLSRWLILFLYSKPFLPAVGVLRALLVGITALSVSRVLANDIAGRGRPILNTYSGAVVVASNIILNLLWLPRYGILGAAWASTISYNISFVLVLYFYSRLSGNPWWKVVLPQRGDWALYLKTGKALFRWGWGKIGIRS